ncbi:MAG: helix-turn-helix transcriptional regulator [Delftia acidovorans]|nr:helix-turn-helix transcriptional regulator [Delftia acidovorans]
MELAAPGVAVPGSGLARAPCLIDGLRRFNDLCHEMPGISQRSLAPDLRALEEAGLVKRTVDPTTTIKAVYELTQDGDRLKPVVE